MKLFHCLLGSISTSKTRVEVSVCKDCAVPEVSYLCTILFISVVKTSCFVDDVVEAEGAEFLIINRV